MAEKRIKTKRTELKDLQAQLESAKKELERALEIASQTAYCCETTIDGIMRELDAQIENVKEHRKKGLLELDVIKEVV